MLILSLIVYNLILVYSLIVASCSYVERLSPVAQSYVFKLRTVLDLKIIAPPIDAAMWLCAGEEEMGASNEMVTRASCCRAVDNRASKENGLQPFIQIRMSL